LGTVNHFFSKKVLDSGVWDHREREVEYCATVALALSGDSVRAQTLGDDLGRRRARHPVFQASPGGIRHAAVIPVTSLCPKALSPIWGTFQHPCALFGERNPFWFVL